jgi:hypothetical protein
MTHSEDLDESAHKDRAEEDAIGLKILLKLIEIQCRRQGRCPIARCRRSGNCVKKMQAERDWRQGRVRGGPVAVDPARQASALKILKECLRDKLRDDGSFGK